MLYMGWVYSFGPTSLLWNRHGMPQVAVFWRLDLDAPSPAVEGIWALGRAGLEMTAAMRSDYMGLSAHSFAVYSLMVVHLYIRHT